MSYEHAFLKQIFGYQIIFSDCKLQHRVGAKQKFLHTFIWPHYNAMTMKLSKEQLHC
jgi:hypothetical protein